MLSNSRFAADEVFAIRLAVEEALLNAVIHGNQLNPAKEVHVMFTIEANDFGIRIQDEGTGFNPDSVSDPTYKSNADQLRGRGLLLMHHSMDAVRFNAKANVVTLTRSHRVGRTEHAHQPHSTPGKTTLLPANEIAPTNSAQLSPAQLPASVELAGNRPATRYIKPKQRTKGYSKMLASTSPPLTIDLADIFSTEAILIGLQHRAKAGVIAELVQHLVETGASPQRRNNR